MNPFPIVETLKAALDQVKELRHDALGYLFHTFRVHLTDEDKTGHVMLSTLVDHGWQLQGGPIVVEAFEDSPRHVIVTMFLADPRPLGIRASFDFHGSTQMRGELQRG